MLSMASGLGYLGREIRISNGLNHSNYSTDYALDLALEFLHWHYTPKLYPLKLPLEALIRVF